MVTRTSLFLPRDFCFVYCLLHFAELYRICAINKAPCKKFSEIECVECNLVRREQEKSAWRGLLQRLLGCLLPSGVMQSLVSIKCAKLELSTCFLCCLWEDVCICVQVCSSMHASVETRRLHWVSSITLYPLRYSFSLVDLEPIIHYSQQTREIRLYIPPLQLRCGAIPSFYMCDGI